MSNSQLDAPASSLSSSAKSTSTTKLSSQLQRSKKLRNDERAGSTGTGADDTGSKKNTTRAAKSAGVKAKLKTKPLSFKFGSTPASSSRTNGNGTGKRFDPFTAFTNIRVPSSTLPSSQPAPSPTPPASQSPLSTPFTCRSSVSPSKTAEPSQQGRLLPANTVPRRRVRSCVESSVSGSASEEDELGFVLPSLPVKDRPASRNAASGKARQNELIDISSGSESDEPVVSKGRISVTKSSTKSGKGKARDDEPVDDRLWIDVYEPTTEGELAVHIKKVQAVREWLLEAFEGGPSGRLTKYRRILVLTGPAGAGKTATIKVLAREMGFEIMEWRNSISESSTSRFGVGESPYPSFEEGNHYESLAAKFETFLNRAATCQNIFSILAPAASSSSSQVRPASAPCPKRQIILLEDLPNILHAQTQARFHAALQSVVDSTPSNPPVPIVVVVSDAGLRGEASDEVVLMNGIGSGAGGRGFGGRGGEGGGEGRAGVVDVRTVFPKALLGGPYVTQVGFNAIAPTLMQKALLALMGAQLQLSSSSLNPSKPAAAKSKTISLTQAQSKELVSAVVENSNGDIRSAIMALQFACIAVGGDAGRAAGAAPAKGKGKATKGKGSAATKKLTTRGMMEVITRREHSLALFHLLGKILYNKRKGDPPNASLSAKEKQKEKELDAALRDPPSLPSYLQEHERRASRVDVDALYADSPIDTSLLSLYIHQNYQQFCNELEEIDGVAEWLSWVDSSGGESWYQTTPHQFHVLALGTMHCLPSPVVRRAQTVGKPEWFEHWRREKEAHEAVADVQDWLGSVGRGRGLGFGSSKGGGGGGVGRVQFLRSLDVGVAQLSESSTTTTQPEATTATTTETATTHEWTLSQIATELGAILKALDAEHASANALRINSNSDSNSHAPPLSHLLFSRFDMSTFSRGWSGAVAAAAATQTSIEGSHGRRGGARNFGTEMGEADLAIDLPDYEDGSSGGDGRGGNRRRGGVVNEDTTDAGVVLGGWWTVDDDIEDVV